MKRYFYITIILVSLIACKETTDFYLGIPLQPKFEENSYTPGLNIFGVLRSDSTGNYNNSFIEIQKVMPALGNNDSIEVDTVLVNIENISGTSPYFSYGFKLTNGDSTFKKSNYRPVTPFDPKPGDIYAIVCEYPDLPVLRATTIIPNKAEILFESYFTTNEFLSFEILSDSTFFMLDVYLYSGGTIILSSRYATENNANTLIEMSVNGTSVDSVIIFSYDYNMAKYYLTSNTSLNFNKYRNSYSTVENGYGVFGSLNKNVVIFRE
jgi:hypothetical protein